MPCVSQSSVTTHLRCGGIFNDHLITVTNLLPTLALTEFFNVGQHQIKIETIFLTQTGLWPRFLCITASPCVCMWVFAVCRWGSGWTWSRIQISSLTFTSLTSLTRACLSWLRRSWTAALWANINSAKIHRPVNFSMPKTFQSTASGSKGTVCTACSLCGFVIVPVLLSLVYISMVVIPHYVLNGIHAYTLVEANSVLDDRDFWRCYLGNLVGILWRITPFFFRYCVISSIVKCQIQLVLCS